MKSNTLTIIKKEFARFFGDRQLLFTALIMPGLLIYLIYTFLGNGIQNMVTSGAQEVVTMRVENMPSSLAPMLTTIDSSIVIVDQPFDDEEIKLLEDKGLNLVLLRFPADFEQRMHWGSWNLCSADKW